MNRKLAIGLAAAGGALLLFSRRGRAAPRNNRILLLGDSHVEQSWNPHNGIGYRLAQIYGSRLTTMARGGMDMIWIASHAPNGDFGTVVAVAGTNNLFPSSSVQDAALRFTSMLRAKFPAARIIWHGPPGVRREAMLVVLRAALPVFRAAAAQNQIEFVDQSSRSSGSDGIHLDSYATWAQDIARTIGA